MRWYNIEDIVQTLEAMQKTTAFYHDNFVDMLKLVCTLPNLANICLYNYQFKFLSLHEGRQKLIRKKSRKRRG